MAQMLPFETFVVLQSDTVGTLYAKPYIGIYFECFLKLQHKRFILVYFFWGALWASLQERLTGVDSF